MVQSLKQKFLSFALFSSMVLGGSYVFYNSYTKHSALDLTTQDLVLRRDMDSLKTRINYLVEDAPLDEQDLFKDLKKTTYLYKACKLADNYSSLQDKIDYKNNPSRSGEWLGFGLFALGALGFYTLTIKEKNILPEPDDDTL